MIRVILVPTLLALSLSVAAKAAPAKTAATSKAQIDARGVAALARSAAFYRRQQSFSLLANETLAPGAKTRRFQYRLNLQGPQRASLRSVALGPPGQKNISIQSALVDANSYYFSFLNDGPSVRPLVAPITRENAIIGMFMNSPALEYSILPLATGYQPAAQSVRAIRYATIRDGNRSLIQVSVVRRDAGDPLPYTIDMQFAPQTYALQNAIFRRSVNGKDATATARFEAPVPNWKGTQKATDFAVYNWNKVAPDLAIYAAGGAANNKIVSVDARARVIWARAIALYHATPKLRVTWRTDGGTDLSSLEFSRAGLLRLKLPGTEELTVVDGKNSWHLDAFAIEPQDKAHYTREPIEPGEAYPAALMGLDFGSPLSDALGGFLGARQDLWNSQIDSQVRALKLTKYRVTVPPAQTLNGEMCDLVRFETVAPNPDKTPGSTTNQKTYWFARSNGRLVRLQFRSQVGKNDGDESDEQIDTQDFNPTFAPDAFKFVAPKGAVLQAN